jgi:hypothetical protein
MHHAMGDTPSISGTTYGTNTAALHLAAFHQPDPDLFQHDHGFEPLLRQRRVQQITHSKEQNMATQQLRMVQVLIADDNDNLPIEQRLIYKGDPKLTDSTDQELFFEIDIKTLLDNHNAIRVKTVDKKVKERTEYLEPVKIRELKMVVVNIAVF